MNILFIHHVADLYGSSRCLLRLAARLVADGHTVASTLQEDGPLRTALEQAGVSVFLLPELPVLHRAHLARPSGWLHLFRNMLRTRKTLRGVFDEFRPDLVHTNSATLLPVAGALARKAGIPHIQHVRESFIDFGFAWKLYRLLLSRRATRLICISDYVAGTFSPRQQRTKTTTIYDGLPAGDFAAATDASARHFVHQHEPGHPLIVLVGRIKLKRKGQDVLVRAAALLRESCPSARYALVGSPFPGNEEHLAALRAMIRDLGLEKHIALTGHLDQPLDALAACDISIMASSTPEPLGNVTLESMALGKAVVGTACGATPELIRDGENGFLVPPDDPAAMAAAIGRLVSDPGLRERLGTQARTDFLARFEFEPHYRAVLSVYQQSLPALEPTSSKTP
ncbi:MAG TPA: glycosyltransferase family 4 protein [Kiritimatiellia bacterium]|nr:glycosyltransferase family 4 protein [Kiritimatiellia bacterium]